MLPHRENVHQIGATEFTKCLLRGPPGYRFLETLVTACGATIIRDGLIGMANALDLQWRSGAPVPASRTLADIQVFDDLSQAEPFWRSLQAHGAASTPYQNFDFLTAWHHHVGAVRGVTPFVIVGFDAHTRPMCLLPLGIHGAGPFRRASFLGGKHANYNFGVWDRSAAAHATADDLRFLLQRIAAAPQRPDLLTLYSQPRAWGGVDNPFLRLPHRQAPSNGASLVIDAPGNEVLEREVSAATRGRLRSKERKLQKLAGYRYFKATHPDEVDRLLNRFFALKTAHMAAQGLPNVFAEDEVKAFVRSACHRGLDGGRPAVELHGLEGGGELLALFGALNDGQSLSVMINTYTLSDNAKHSPGLILILQMIQMCADNGIRLFDLGAGDATYKSWFCKQPIHLFDSFLPLTPLGRLSASGLDTASAVKREVKHAPALWSAYRSLRRTLNSVAGERPPRPD